MIAWFLTPLVPLTYNELWARRHGLPTACQSIRNLSKLDRALMFGAYLAVGAHIFAQRGEPT